SVRHTPPPAAAAQTRQFDTEQLGEIARAVIRPEVTYGAPLKVRTSGKFVVLGPIRFQVPILLFPRDRTVWKAVCAFSVARKGTYAAGYARFAYSSSALAVGPPSRSAP